MKNQYFTSAQDSQKGIHFFRFNTETQSMEVNNKGYKNNLYTWPCNMTKNVIKTYHCIPAMLGTVIKYDWPSSAYFLIKEYFNELAGE